MDEGRLLTSSDQGLLLSGQRAPRVTPLTLAWDLPTTPGNACLSLLGKRLLLSHHSCAQQPPPRPTSPDIWLSLVTSRITDNSHSACTVKASPTAVCTLSEALVPSLPGPQSRVWRGDFSVGCSDQQQPVPGPVFISFGLLPSRHEGSRWEPVAGARKTKGVQEFILPSQNKLINV